MLCAFGSATVGRALKRGRGRGPGAEARVGARLSSGTKEAHKAQHAPRQRCTTACATACVIVCVCCVCGVGVVCEWCWGGSAAAKARRQQKWWVGGHTTGQQTKRAPTQSRIESQMSCHGAVSDWAARRLSEASSQNRDGLAGGRLEMATRSALNAGRLFEKTLERGPQSSAIISP